MKRRTILGGALAGIAAGCSRSPEAPRPVKSQREIKTLQAARRAMFVNYVARISKKPEEYIANACKRLQMFMDEWG